MSLTTNENNPPISEQNFSKQMLFIIGAPRSGTTWLQALIGAHPMVATSVQMGLFNYYFAPWIKQWNQQKSYHTDGKWDDGLPYLFTEDEFFNYLQQFAMTVYQKISEINPEASHVLDKHPEYSPHVQTIHQFFPDAKFIHIIRDGRDQVSSALAARKNMGWGPTNVSEAAQNWRDRVLESRKASQYNGKYHELKYEDLLHSPNQTMRSVFEFCELLISDDELNQIIADHQFEKMKSRRQAGGKNTKMQDGHYRKGQYGTWSEEFTVMKRYIFSNYAGDLLHELGYAKSEWWTENKIMYWIIPFAFRVNTFLYKGLNFLATRIKQNF